MNGIRLYDAQGSDKGLMPLQISLEKEAIAPKTYACAVKVLLQNWRQGTVSCKGRGEVNFSGKKPWKQKGTGRARAGMASSPVWRKGGVSFGPQMRTRTLSLPKRQRVRVLNNLFFATYEAGNVHCLDFDSNQTTPRTKTAFDALKMVGLHNKKIVMFLPTHDGANFAAFRNIPAVYMLHFDQPNAYDLSVGRQWVFLKKDIEHFNKMVAKWNSVYTTL